MDLLGLNQLTKNIEFYGKVGATFVGVGLITSLALKAMGVSTVAATSAAVVPVVVGVGALAISAVSAACFLAISIAVVSALGNRR